MRPYKKDNTFKKIAGFLLAGVVILAAIFFLRRGNGDEPGREVPVYGTVDDTGSIVVDEEVGVFEDPAADDVVTMPPVEDGAKTTRQPPEAVRTRATAAIPRYETALADKGGDPLLLNNYAWSLHQAGRYAEAERTLREVIRIAPNRSIAYANLGESLWKQGKNKEAAAMYRKFLAMNTDPRRERIAEAKVAQITAETAR